MNVATDEKNSNWQLICDFGNVFFILRWPGTANRVFIHYLICIFENLFKATEKFKILLFEKNDN